MTLTPGTRLGPYEVVAQIGVGGMGEVYKATDTNLKRSVAIKVLPASVAGDAERLARFQREAEVLAALNHPNIAAIYGLERSGTTTALVMELVEGPTLADRIAQGAIPIDEALPIAKQIAEALEAAHEQGIIHRDLKPANIKIRPDGTVKVLDFGLAKAMEPTGATAASNSMSPTITTPAMTQAGMILGTAAYMSPEQARGKTVDKRSDIWAFGCVLYEMLTGKRAFEGEDVSDTLAGILRGEPQWNALPSATPAIVRRLLQRTLKRDRKDRLPDIGSARLDLIDASSEAFHDSAVPTTASGTALFRRGWMGAAMAGMSIVAIGAALAVWGARGPQAAAPGSLHIRAQLGTDALLPSASGTHIALSPDGRTLAFVAQTDGTGDTALYVRRLDQLDALRIAGTEGASGPFFSPDGQWIAFFADTKLKKVPPGGGTVSLISNVATAGRGASWGDDGTIVFSVFEPQGGGALMRVAASGGVPKVFTKLGVSEVSHRWPQMLPGGRGVLYTASSGVGTNEDADILVQPLNDGERTRVQRGGYFGRYLASGHLAYMHEGVLMAAPFDLNRFAITGPAVPYLQNVSADAYAGGSALFDASVGGTIAYVSAQTASNDAPISWMTSTGDSTPLRSTPSNWSNPAFSPDGTRLAVDISDALQTDIWIYDWARDAMSRLTSTPGTDERAVWTPDSRRIVLRSTRDGRVSNLYWQRADGVGDVQRLTESPNPQRASSWDPTGRMLAFHEDFPDTSSDLMMLPMEGSEATGWRPGKPTVFLRTRFAERTPMFSPDGKWIAYFSDESGRQELYVRSYPGPGGKWQVSTTGGAYAHWSTTEPKMFYSTPDERIMVVSYVVEGDSFRAGKPQIWSPRPFQPRQRDRSFDVHPDGKRVALALAPDHVAAAARQDHVTLIIDAFGELRRLAPGN